MRTTVFIFLFVIVSCTNLFDTVREEDTETIDFDRSDISGFVLWAGLAKGEAVESETIQNIFTGTKTLMTNIQRVEKNDRIGIEDGSIIYLSYSLSNLPRGESIQGFRETLIFPRMINGEGKVFFFHENEFELLKKVDKTTARREMYWTFFQKNPIEMVEGWWVMQVWLDERLLIEKRFYAYYKR